MFYRYRQIKLQVKNIYLEKLLLEWSPLRILLTLSKYIREDGRRLYTFFYIPEIVLKRRWFWKKYESEF